MSELQNRLKSLQPYLIQLRFPDGQPVVDMVFKKGWNVPQSEIIQSTKGDSEDLNYHFFYSTDDSIGLDEILNYIEKVIGLNIERENKHELLKLKVKELQDLFRKNPLSKLQGMRYVLGGQKLVEDMEADPLDVVDFDIETPVVQRPQPKPQPKPQEVTEEVTEEPIVDNPNVRRAPNGEIIPPLTPVDNGDIDDEFQKFDLGGDEPVVTKNVNGRNIDLPKKVTPKTKLLEIDEPTNIVCKCTEPDDVCPACEESKIGGY